jgi:hypothetical protein
MRFAPPLLCASDGLGDRYHHRSFCRTYRSSQPTLQVRVSITRYRRQIIMKNCLPGAPEAWIHPRHTKGGIDDGPALVEGGRGLYENTSVWVRVHGVLVGRTMQENRINDDVILLVCKDMRSCIMMAPIIIRVAKMALIRKSLKMWERKFHPVQFQRQPNRKSMEAFLKRKILQFLWEIRPISRLKWYNRVPCRE